MKWPHLNWDRLAQQTKPLQERPAIGPNEKCQKRVAIFQVILEAQGVTFDQENDEAKAIIYKLGRGRMTYDRAYKELECYAIKPESDSAA